MLSSKHIPLVVAVSLAATALGNTGVNAQTPPTKTAPVVQIDARFARWVGCWRLENDVTGSGIRVCVIPDKVYNVRIETLVGAQRGEIESLVPDNVAHAITDPTCTGTEKSEWSKDGERVFRWADVTCGSDALRNLSSVLFMIDGPVLVEVQHVSSGVDQNVRVKRYRRALDQSLPDGSIAPQPSLRSADAAVAGSWDIADVIEASGKIPGDAVQAALSEVDQPFDLNKKSLLAMADAKVSGDVIDLMVALTYPRKLQVERSSGGGGGGSTNLGLSGVAGLYGTSMYDPFFSPIIPANCFSMYNYGFYSTYSGQCGWYYGSQYSYRYSPFGFYSGYYGYGYPYYDYGNTWVAVGPPVGGTVTPQPDSRVINGRGYTQIRPRENEPGAVAGRNYGSTGSSSGSSSGGTSSGSSSGASSSGYSGGSSSGSSGGSSGGGERTAVSRPPGGGN